MQHRLVDYIGVNPIEAGRNSVGFDWPSNRAPWVLGTLAEGT
jgi:hypothetical protein